MTVVTGISIVLTYLLSTLPHTVVEITARIAVEVAEQISHHVWTASVYQIMSASAQRSAVVDLKNVQNVPIALIILIVVAINTAV